MKSIKDMSDEELLRLMTGRLIRHYNQRWEQVADDADKAGRTDIADDARRMKFDAAAGLTESGSEDGGA